MGYYAKVVNGYVVNVIRAEPEFFEKLVDSEPGIWVETDKKVQAGVHSEGGVPLRKNYAGPGFEYDEDLDAFIPPKKHKSWIFNEETCQYDPPTPLPGDSKDYFWDEEKGIWEDISKAKKPVKVR